MRIGDSQPSILPGLAGADAGAASAAGPEDAKLDAARLAVARGDAGDASKQFEKLFCVMLVRELRRSMPESPFGDGPGADVYEGWFDEQLGGSLAQRDALGLAGMVKAAIGRAQAARDATAGAAKTELAP